VIIGLGGTTAAARLRFQKSRYVSDFVSNRRAVDAPELAPDIQPAFLLQYLHTAAADRGVDVFIDPCPRDGRNLGQIDEPVSTAHIVTAMPVSGWQV
jgi:shikimate 5-dehydrogenase